MLVGLWVTDHERYRQYRAAMAPLLARFGGAFGYDFVVSEVLKTEVEAPINRVFTMTFPDHRASEAFFADPEYVAVRAALFEPSVGHTTILAEY